MTGQGNKKHRLSDSYRFDGFDPVEGEIRGVFGDRVARILPLKRRSKKLHAAYAGRCEAGGMTAGRGLSETCRVVTRGCISRLSSGVWTVGSAAK